MATRAPLWLRPVHQWFFFWERVISSVYRVVAVVLAALATTTVASWALPIAWFIVAPCALAIWIGLAVLQEHDERVSLPVDSAFLSMLNRHVTPLLASQGFDRFASSGPTRAHASREESFIYQSSNDPKVIFIYRDPLAMMLGVDGHNLPLTGDHEMDAKAIVRELQRQERSS